MRVMTLISGGIDSPVAAYLMMAKGHEVDLIHFDSRPYSDEANIDKILSLAKRLADLANGHRPRLFFAPHAKVQETIKEKAPSKLTCILCRRMMFRIASALAGRESIEALATGESLGQVASQTSENIRTQEPAASISVIRPLIGLDKIEIIDIAESIGTFELSIASGEGCTMAPDRPATRTKLKELEGVEAKYDVHQLVTEELKAVTEVTY